MNSSQCATRAASERATIPPMGLLYDSIGKDYSASGARTNRTAMATLGPTPVTVRR